MSLPPKHTALLTAGILFLILLLRSEGVSGLAPKGAGAKQMCK